MDVLALIPARGGSKGIPRKNLCLLGGLPLVARTVEAARGARCVTRVAVSTDDPEIAAVARAHGAEVVMRPPELSTDAASSESALLHALGQLRAGGAPDPELVVFLQCTSPFTLPADIDGTVESLLAGKADSAFSASRFSHFLWRRDESGAAVGVGHDKSARPRRQERGEEYLENGAVYAMRTAGFLAARHRFFGRTVIHPMPAERSLEIDEPGDLLRAEAALRRMEAERRSELLPRKVSAVVFDFDGVFTDNRVLTLQDGGEAVLCDRGDGMGISLLRRRGVPMLVLSTEANPVVKARCDKLSLECLHDQPDKLAGLTAWLGKRGIPLAETVFVGNDVNDMSCLAAAGCGAVPADAHPGLLPAARIVLASRGGRGAVREVCDLVLRKLEGRDA